MWACRGAWVLLHDGSAVLQATRVLAAVLAKNAVGSSWRKTLGSREWSRVPAEEKAGVRSAALRLLFAEPAERVAVQLAMLVTNIARYKRVVEQDQLAALLSNSEDHM